MPNSVPGTDNIIRSRAETYWLCTVGGIGAFTLLHGVCTHDIGQINIGFNLIAHAVTFYVSNRNIYRATTLIGAVSTFLAPMNNYSNALSVLPTVAAGLEYLNGPSDERQSVRLTFN
jgi:hypothetical protein